jgi:hypothetical protein
MFSRKRCGNRRWKGQKMFGKSAYFPIPET